MGKTIFLGVAFLSVFLTVTACSYENQAYTVLFSDSKGIQPEANVIFSGFEIGEVKKVRPSGTGIAVDFYVEVDFRNQITTASEFFIDNSGAIPVLRVKNLEDTAVPLSLGTIVEGTDTLLAWDTKEYFYAYEKFSLKMNECCKKVFDDLSLVTPEPIKKPFVIMHEARRY